MHFIHPMRSMQDSIDSHLRITGQAPALARVFGGKFVQQVRMGPFLVCDAWAASEAGGLGYFLG